MTVAHYTCNLCDALCGLKVTIDSERITDIRGDPDDPFSRGHTCPKGAALRELHEDPDRLRQPLRRISPGRWEPVSWDEALAEAAARLGEIRARHGRDAVGLYVGNPVAHSHRAALGAQLLTMALQTHNRFDANSQDGNPRLFACMQMYGDALSMPIPDVDRCDLLIILGANPAASNGSQMSLGDVRKRLTRIPRKILIDPRRTETAAWCDEHHFIRPGGDAAFLLALIQVLFEMEPVPDLEELASGVGELRRLSAPFSPERVAPAVGIEARVIRRLARELRETPRAALYARIGASQNPFGPVANWLVEAVNVLSGHFDREGGVMFAQPAADVAPLGRRLIGNHWGRWRSRVRGLPEMLGALPSVVMAEEMETAGQGRIRGFISVAGNPVLSTPNGPRLERALAGLEHFVAIDFYLNETSRHAHLVLPPAHVFESSNFNLLFLGLAVRNLARHDRPILPRRGRDDWEIASELALRLRLPARLASTVPGLEPMLSRLTRLLARRARDLPDRLVDVLLRSGRHRLSLSELARHPHGLDLGPLRPCRREKVHTPDGRVALAPAPLVADLPRLERWLNERQRHTAGGAMPDEAELLLIGRRHLRSNNSWMHNLRSLTKGPSRAQLLMHPLDAGARALTQGLRVRIESQTGAVEAELALSDSVGRGVVSLPHGFGHGEIATLRIAGALDGPNLNALTGEVEPLLGTSILNGIPVRVLPV